MNADDCVHAVVLIRQRHRRAAGLDIRAGGDDDSHSRVRRARDDRFEVISKLLVVEMAVRVNEVHVPSRRDS